MTNQTSHNSTFMIKSQSTTSDLATTQINSFSNSVSLIQTNQMIKSTRSSQRLLVKKEKTQENLWKPQEET